MRDLWQGCSRNHGCYGCDRYSLPRACTQAAGLAADAVAGHYAAYLVELALPDYGMLKYSNSMVAVAAVQLTNRCAQSRPPCSH